jgi:hypothetical protein
MQILPDRYPRTLDIVDILGKRPCFGYPQRGFALLKVHRITEIPNNKSQKTNK